ncbi:cytochrome P450, partial [Conidiobolus coronatus NRRL 28638]
MYLVTAIPEVWKGIPVIPFWERIHRTLTKPVPIDVSFSKYMLPFMQKLGIAVYCSVNKGYTLFISDPECLKQVMSNIDVFIKMPFVGKNHTLLRDYFGAQQVVATNGEDWKRMRKVMNPMFNQSWKPELFGECFNQVIEEWDKLEGKNVLIHDQIQRMTLDVMGKAFFDFDFEAVKNPESELYQLYHNLVSGLYKKIIYRLFPILDRIPYLKRYELFDR